MKEPYDVVVVGSGAGGGMSTYVLTQAGLKVLLLEAGRDYQPATETAMFNVPSAAPLRAAPTPDKPMGFYDATVDGGWELANEPYTNAAGTQYRWWRPRMLGGRTNHWGRVCLRYGPYDFKPYSRDGLGVDWPITYEELAPWYDQVERLIGISGANAGLENAPDSPPDALLPPAPLRANEYFVQRGFESMGIPVAPARLAILTRPFNDRPPCLYATDCRRGCSIRANFQTPTVLLPPARATGNLEIRTHALVYQVDVDQRGLAKGVSFVDRRTGEHHSVRAKAVVLAASACESARILLNSQSARFPQGVANESGLAGRYLTDSARSVTTAHFPALEKLAPRNDDGTSAFHMYVPWWGYGKQARKQLDFPRGYHIEPFGGRVMPTMSGVDAHARICDTAYGAKFKEEVRRRYGSIFAFMPCGEMIPNEQSFVDLDPVVKDKWGIPVLRFHWAWGEPELRQVAHQRRTVLELIDRLGGKPLDGTETDGAKSILPVGQIHEVGGARMGASPRDSVLNSFGQSWSVKNLFVTDGGVFASHADKNPTLTIMALAWRSSAFLVEEARRGSLS